MTIRCSVSTQFYFTTVCRPLTARTDTEVYWNSFYSLDPNSYRGKIPHTAEVVNGMSTCFSVYAGRFIRVCRVPLWTRQDNIERTRKRALALSNAIRLFSSRLRNPIFPARLSDTRCICSVCSRQIEVSQSIGSAERASWLRDNADPAL